MDRKTQFGIDFLFLASEISKVNLINSKDGSDPLAFFVAKLFLLDFDFSHQDIDLTLKAYNDSHVATISKQPQNVQEKDAEIRLSRIYSYINANPNLKQRFYIQICAIVYLTLDFDNDVLKSVLHAMAINLDIYQERDSLIKKGQDLSLYLNIFGITYSSMKREEFALASLTRQK